MFGERDLSDDRPFEGEKLSSQVSERSQEAPDERMSFSDKGIHFLRELEMGLDGFQSKPSRTGNSGSQELTFSYLCGNPKLGFPEKLTSAEVLLSSLEKASHKGKEVVISNNSNQDEKWVERDFLNMNENRGSSLKRDVEEETDEREIREKRPKIETLNLSLALPDVSLSLTASNALHNVDTSVRPKPSRSLQSLAPSNNNTLATCSNDFTAASLSYSYSHPFSHNPSCSLTRNSTENYEHSVGRDDQMWCGGEGTNGSVHSRFRPIGDGVALNNHGGGGYSLMQGNRAANKESCNNNSLYRTTSSDNISFFPSELPARPRVDTLSGDVRKRNSEDWRGLESIDGGRARKLSRPERILREMVSESVPVISQIIQELPDETLEVIREYLKNLIVIPDNKEEFKSLQNQLERRSDLTKETLSKCHKNQLDILVAVKTGLASFLSVKVRVPKAELVEIFLSMRCRNLNCKSLLPVDDCDCKICSANKGFCSSCMCPICLNFDCANNTCSWVGCDVCSHWCHAACGIQCNLIRPGPSLKGPSGTTEMQFHCIGCGHASEMFGFVKDVFMCCAKEWGLETLIKELDCVRKIFRGSDDFKGKELHVKADELLSELETRLMSPSDACNFIIQFFNYTDATPDLPESGLTTQTNPRRETLTTPPATSLLPKVTNYNTSSSSKARSDITSNEIRHKDLKSALMSDLKIKEDLKFERISKNEDFDSLESIVRIKEAEARMFQSKADEALREAEGFKQMMRAKSEKLEEEYAEKLAKLCLQETEERRRKKLEELKVLENSHCDYYNMKRRMQAEIAGLLERMEATKQQLV